jgi:uncharacterized protein (DUF58 family)
VTPAQRPDTDLAEILDEVRRIDVQTRRLVTGVMAGGYLSVFRGVGIEFDAVREYADGDDPRRVDWNVTARVGRPMVKTYVDERELTVLFLLDLSASMDGGFGLWSVRQTAARVIACLGLAAVSNGDKVGLVAFSEDVDAYVAPRKGFSHVLRIVRDCLALPAGSPGTALAPALRFTARAVRKHAIVFLLSDFLTSDWERPLTVCARRHDVIAVRFLTPELQAPGRGLLRVRDPERGTETVLDMSSRRVRRAYAERVAAWRMETERALRRAEVDRMDVPVPRTRGKDLFVHPILRFFRMRELRGRKR